MDETPLLYRNIGRARWWPGGGLLRDHQPHGIFREELTFEQKSEFAKLGEGRPVLGGGGSSHIGGRAGGVTWPQEGVWGSLRGVAGTGQGQAGRAS